MKKLLALLLCIVLAFSVMGCKKDDAPSPVDEKPAEEQTDKETKNHKEGITAQKKAEAAARKEFSLNPYYLTLMGREKGEIDSILGTPDDFSSEYGLSYYGDDVSYGYNSIGYSSNEEIPSESTAVSAYIRLSSLFYNCPDIVTEDDLKKIFPDGSMGFDEMNEVPVFSAEYEGIYLSFSFVPDLPSDTGALVKVPDNFTPLQLEGTAN